MSKLTGQVPPAMIRSKDSAVGMPWLMQELAEWTDSLMDSCFSLPLREFVEDDVT